MKRYGVATLVLALALLVPRTASASWFIGLGAGVNRGGSLPESQTTFTGQLGTVDPDKLAGFEFDFGYAKLHDDVGVRTFTAALLMGHKVFGEFRAYGSIGGGLIGAVTRFNDIFKVVGDRPNDGVITFGGGLMGNFTTKLGARFDVRQFMDIKKEAVQRFHYTRITVGAYLNF